MQKRPDGFPSLNDPLLTVMKAKIHRAVVTGADLDYEGSIAIDRVLLDQAGILPYEQVHVYDINNGERFITYAIEAPAESGVVCVNGAAARLVMPGDRVIIVSFAQMLKSDAEQYKPKVVLIRDDNRPQ